MRINGFRLFLAFALLLGFLPLPLLLSRHQLFVLLDAVTVCIAVGVIVAYARGALDWITDARTTAGHLLILGIISTWLALGGRVAWMWIFHRILGYPAAIFDHWFIALTLYWAIIGGGLHLLANRAIENKIPPSGWATLLIVVGAGVLAGATLVITGYGSPP